MDTTKCEQDEFGDFKTFTNEQPTPTLGSNVFEADLFEFKTFVTNFEENLTLIYEQKSNHKCDDSVFAIRSQEDIINDCPIWLNLSGSFNSKPALNFKKSVSFDSFCKSLMLHNGESNKSCATVKEEEEEIASDLDMHSLIIGSVEQEISGKNEIFTADQVIEEIENMISNGIVPNSLAASSKPTKIDPLLSLNASTLLDAIQTWQVNGGGDPEEYHSLPANLHTSHNSLDESVENGIDLNESMLLTLQASNIVLNSKLPPSSPLPEAVVTNSESDLCKKLAQLSIVQLNELYIELEQIIQIRSEILIQELALRDELEFEKELKNKFISLLLSVQNKRRLYSSSSNNSAKSSTNRSRNRRFVRRNSNDSIRSQGLMARALDLTSFGVSIRDSLFHSSQPTPVYLTTVIPYTVDMNPLDVPTLEMLIKLLKALNEDSATVPSLLTDYILKVICP